MGNDKMRVVSLRGFNGPMTEHHRDGSNIGTTRQEPGSERIAEAVRVAMNSAELADAFQGPTNITLNCGEFPSTTAEDWADKFAERLVKAIRKQDADRDIRLNGRFHRDVSPLDVVSMESGNIGNSEAGPEEHIDQKQGVLPDSIQQGGVAVAHPATRGTNSGNLSISKRHRSSRFIPWVFDACSWIRRYPSTIKAKIEERSDRLPFLADSAGGKVHGGDEAKDIVPGDVIHVASVQLPDGTFVNFDCGTGYAAETAISNISTAAKIERVLRDNGIDTSGWNSGEEALSGCPIPSVEASADAPSVNVAIDPDRA